MKTSIRKAILSLATLAAVGCASPAASEEAQSAEDALSGTAETGCSAPEGKAIVTMSNDVKEAPARNPDADAAMYTCSKNVQVVQVLGLKGAAQTKINASLRSIANRPEYAVKEAECDRPFDLNGYAQVRFNAENLLSVTTSMDSYFAGAPHPSGYTLHASFDLLTGNRLQLADIITAGEGKEAVKAELIAAIQRSHASAEDKEVIVSAAKSLLARSSSTIEEFTITKGGLRFSVSNELPHALMGLPADYLVPFAKIHAFIKPGTAVAELSAKAKR